LIKKQSPVERKKENRESKRKLKRSIEDVWAETDVASHLSQRVSFSTRKKQRLFQGFESKASAKERVSKRQQCGNTKTHVPTLIAGNLEQLQEDMQNWPEGKVNWSAKAKFYEIRKQGSHLSPPNAGQLLKEYLKSQGVNIGKFEPEYTVKGKK